MKKRNWILIVFVLGVVVVAVSLFTLTSDGGNLPIATEGDNLPVIAPSSGDINLHVEPDKPWPKN